MEKLDLSKLKLASSSISNQITQMGRSISSKMKELLQPPSPESKAVDEATAAEPNWGLNLRICAMIGSGDYDGAEVVRAIKKKLRSTSPVSQGSGLELLEVCASNCEKVFAAVASERLLEDMVRLVEDSRTEHGNRVRAMQLIEAWGESEELAYLPVFRQTYMNLKSKEIPPPPAAHHEENYPPMHYNLESYLGLQLPQPPPGTYPIPYTGAENDENATFIGYDFESNEEKKEFLAGARNSLQILSSILNSDAEPKPLKDDLTITMLEKCKQSLHIIQRIIESASDDEVMLFDALNLHEELQLVISRHDEMVASELSAQPKDNEATLPMQSPNYSTNETKSYSKVGGSESNKTSRDQEETGADKSS